ncbi:MAG: hypothetical protein AB8B49_08760 [Nitratireductor sp.]
MAFSIKMGFMQNTVMQLIISAYNTPYKKSSLLLYLAGDVVKNLQVFSQYKELNFVFLSAKTKMLASCG